MSQDKAACPVPSVDDLPRGLSDEELDRVLAMRRAQRWADQVRASLGLTGQDITDSRKCCQGLDPECQNEADCDARTGRVNTDSSGSSS